MSSAYAPLPFSYLSADGPKPRAGMRKDGVYGTSADVAPRIYEEPEPSQRGDDRSGGNGFLNNPYSVYANAPNNSAQQVRLDNYEAVYRPSQAPQPVGLMTPGTQESPYDVRQRLDLLEDRSQKPGGAGGEYNVYSIPEADYVTSDKDLRQREDRRPGYGGNLQREPSTSRQERIQSYFPPQDAGRQTPDIDKYSRGQNEMTPSANDNFILVKDPNRTDQKPVSDAAALSRDAGKTKLQTLFEDNGHTPTPRYDHINTSNPSRVAGFEEPNHSSSYGLNTTERPTGNGKGPKEMTSKGHRDKTAYAAKGGKGKQCCHCSTCTAVIIAIIITAIICLGVGFVAGWFGAIADREKNATNPPIQSTDAFSEQATNSTTAAANSLATTKESSSTTKTSTTSSQLSSTTTTSTSAHSHTSSATVSSSTTSHASTKSGSTATG